MYESISENEIIFPKVFLVTDCGIFPKILSLTIVSYYSNDLVIKSVLVAPQAKNIVFDTYGRDFLVL